MAFDINMAINSNSNFVALVIFVCKKKVQCRKTNVRRRGIYPIELAEFVDSGCVKLKVFVCSGG